MQDYFCVTPIPRTLADGSLTLLGRCVKLNKHGASDDLILELTLITQTFRDNRAQFPGAELAAHKREWVVFSTDGTRIMAGARALEGLEAVLQAMGVNGQDVVLEGLGGIDDTRFLGVGERI